MNDKNKIITGLVIFFLVALFPFWFNLIFGASDAAKGPDPVLTDKAKEAETCVADTQFMRTEHMQLLDQWRDTVVRDGQRIYVVENGNKYEASLSNTCMDCHSNKADFCDKCHNYASVTPYCWDCHTYPEETK
ncbi:MAG: sulfate reduction electron transfer complex DsrMKJOP subunit DsrJ [Desulfobacteraceae bacterium]|nr:sulfate reduction electron transfer complex DsrMKJOP subunit DsrJ [Desulfobacteraceae bacterium]MCF8095153.1 sulfate reduction electron transfer complex DsrMKJOP subunit DsrJ [Desulfobacteraceae bacterium]